MIDGLIPRPSEGVPRVQWGQNDRAETGHGGMLAEKGDEENRTVAETSNLGL